ncbi:hypothetical protein [Taibaiella helva]|uniref:hypothetical protein n=1 Tax=Taibaiella helva TaxID=2301235 RepID=UPI000E58C82E|nr:hypothetical protein [Taibaiella helva]
MKRTTPILFASGLALLLGADAAAQQHKTDPAPAPWQIDTLLNPIPTNRAMFTDKVKEQVKKADLRDGEVDGKIELEDPTVSGILVQALLVKAPRIMIHIENMNIPHQTKIQYHRALANMLRRLNARGSGPDDAAYIKKSVDNFEELMLAREQDRLADYVKANDNIYTLDNSELFDDHPELKSIVFASVGKAKPEMMIQRLPQFARESYADPVIAAAAQVMPGTILTYASSTSSLSAAVRRNQDPFVKVIVAIADQAKNPQKVLPFVAEIYEGKTTIAAVDGIANDPKAYFQALVNLRMQGQSVANKAIEEEINFRGLQFVRVVNELHDSPAPVRFKSLMDFNAEDLYFMMIGSQDEIYTSSFTWMFDRMMEKMKPTSGDAFLAKVQKSHFRTFLRMAAGYNKLSPFLASMEENAKNELMKEFVANLEQGPMDDLEDAVDVADAFGSINDPKLIAFLKEEIRTNYEKKVNEKGVIVYALLYTIFNSAENAEQLNANVSDLLPPITYVPYASLKDEQGDVVQQVFFYGDKDGMGAYRGYLNLFRNAKWKIEQNQYWAAISSTGANPVRIFVNVPLPEEAEENDVFAQTKLQQYLDDNNIHPSVVIHRGHSYYLPTTLEHLQTSVKIVILGSCGGYHNLSKVLNSSPDAHIISSKQIGAYAVNVPIISALNDVLLAGKDVNWISMWQNLSKYFAGRGAGINDLFSDYVPPNKNLGAIFIKAYRKQAMLMGKE